jgi:hypothetical protein
MMYLHVVALNVVDGRVGHAANSPILAAVDGHQLLHLWTSASHIRQLDVPDNEPLQSRAQGASTRPAVQYLDDASLLGVHRIDLGHLLLVFD